LLARWDFDREEFLMIAALLALQITQVQPVIRPAAPAVAHRNLQVAQMSPKQRTVAEARAVLDSALKVQATYAPADGQPTKAELDASIDQMRTELDSMSEMGETESLRLQMAMDRMSKMMTTLSNLLKKISDTQNAIVQNIK
jgi:hypothetical protein